MLRPTKQSLRPCSCARSVTICSRCMDVAKQEISTRPLASPMMCDRRCRTARSEGVRPGRSTFVESENSASTPLPPVVGERVQIADVLVRGRGVKFEIAGVNDRAQRRGDGQCAGLNDAVRQVDELHAERSHLERRAGMHLPQVGAFRQIVFDQLGLRQRQRKGRAVDRHINFFQQIGQAADVIFVAMRQQNGADAFAIRTHVTEVGNDNVHAQQFGIRKHDAAVDDDDVIVKLIRHHVHAEFAEATEGNYFQLMV